MLTKRVLDVGFQRGVGLEDEEQVRLVSRLENLAQRCNDVVNFDLEQLSSGYVYNVINNKDGLQEVSRAYKAGLIEINGIKRRVRPISNILASLLSTSEKVLKYEKSHK
ncbi:hypothetical protein V6N13_024987 [Hibiscus sabdariffa]